MRGQPGRYAGSAQNPPFALQARCREGVRRGFEAQVIEEEKRSFRRCLPMRPEAGGFRAKGAGFGGNAARLTYSAFGHERKKTWLVRAPRRMAVGWPAAFQAENEIKTGWTEARRTCL